MRVARPHHNEAMSALAIAIKGIINLPTGTGKSFIQAGCIANTIAKDIAMGIYGVYVVLAPRILLSNQLFASIKEDLVNSGTDCQYLIDNSGRFTSDMEWVASIRELEDGNGLVNREMESTTSPVVIQQYFDKAQREKVPLVIAGTYDSAEQIQKAGVHVRELHCDEAHYLVPNIEENTTGFAWIAPDFIADRKFFYTATMKFTNGNLGMDSVELFGEVLYQKLPLEMILAGEIVRPRMHLVDVTTFLNMSVEDQDAAAVVAAFSEHRAMLAMESSSYIAPKLLVVAKGSEHLNDIVNHPEMQQLRHERPNLTLFDISSAYQPRIDGIVVRREVFLKRLQSLTDMDEAIIIHVRILAEGIDVPGITGIMPLNNLKKSALLQTLGRATRLHSQDRSKLYNGSMLPEELRKFVKPYAWIIIPVYGELGEEIQATITEIVYELRTFGFNPSEDIFVKTSKGQFLPVALGTTNPVDKRAAALHEFFGNIDHTIEDRDISDLLEKMSKWTEEEKDNYIF